MIRLVKMWPWAGSGCLPSPPRRPFSPGPLPAFVGTRHLIIIEIGIRNNRDSWISPLDARVRGPAHGESLHARLLHSPRHQQQLRRGAPRPAEGGAAAVDAEGSSAAAHASKDFPCTWGNAGARAGARVYACRAGSPANLNYYGSRL